MNNPIALQEHIETNHHVLLKQAICPLERLQNMKHTDVYDTGIWISSTDHFTVIYSSLADDLSDCLFQIGVHGKFARAVAKTVFNGKYSGDLNLFELDSALNKIAGNTLEK